MARTSLEREPFGDKLRTVGATVFFVGCQTVYAVRNGAFWAGEIVNRRVIQPRKARRSAESQEKPKE